MANMFFLFMLFIFAPLHTAGFSPVDGNPGETQEEDMNLGEVLCKRCRIGDTMQPVFVLRCGHSFHPNCLAGWINATASHKNRYCPVCMKKILLVPPELDGKIPPLSAAELIDYGTVYNDPAAVTIGLSEIRPHTIGNHMHIAAQHNAVAIAQIFVNLTPKINLNTPDSHGYTPLHYAAESGFLEMVQILVENGADINVKLRISRFEYRTPLDLATLHGHTAIVEYLTTQSVKEECSCCVQ